jgi:hypothetical protein
MATVAKFSSLRARQRRKGIVAEVFDTQFETDGLGAQALTEFDDKLITTLDVPAGDPVEYQAIGFNILQGDSLGTGGGGDTLLVTGVEVAGPLAAEASIAENAVGVKIGSGSTLDLGTGKDLIVTSLVGAGSVGIQNDGTLLTGDDIDKIVADAPKNGLVNTGQIDTGNSGDKIVASSSDGQPGSHAIWNTGTITMGTNDQADKDVITGSSLGHDVLTPSYNPGNAAIYNSGTINMGGGKDVIDALVGGFAGGGTYNLGGLDSRGRLDADDDAVLGFGSGTFNGGGGSNSITLPGGTYHITYTSMPLNEGDLASGYVTREGSEGVQMVFNSFASIGGFDPVAEELLFVDVSLGAETTQTLRSFTVDADFGTVSDITYV